MPKFDAKDEKSKSQILKRLREKVDLDAKLKDIERLGGPDQAYLEIDEHLKTGGYYK